ncbi:MAG: hypothetical protein U9R75_05440 [Candidatus Thermoplasmatota archaeon]|nr:hypothetical protein [Candidatus Thermoplasmatota archaeon]
MRKTFIFDFDDTLANFSMYNTLVIKQPVKILPHIGGLLPGVKEVLDLLSSRGDRLMMLTMNVVLDDDQKWRKLDRLGIRRWFREKDVHFVRHKTAASMIKVVGRVDKRNCYMVGNSLDHDVKPALEAGINAVFIERPLLKRLVPRRRPVSDRLFVLDRIDEIMDIYPRL